MSYEIKSILAFAVFIAAIVGLIRLKKINKAYYPFLFIIWFGALAELASFLIAVGKHNESNAIVFNIYSLIEALLILWFFNKWQLFENNKSILHILIAAILIFWIIEVLIFTNLNTFSFYFYIFQSIIITLLSISLINKISLWETGVLLKNPTALICVCFVVYFTYTVIVETFWIYGLDKYLVFQLRVYDIFVIINFIINLVYVIAILWMPSKLKFTLQY